MRTRRKRIWALGMAVALGVTSVCGYQFMQTQNVNADQTATVVKDKVVFAQGEGILDENGNVVEFSSDSWTFTGRGINSKNETYDVAAAYKPAIVDDAKENKYLKSTSGVDTTNVIRLIRGVKESTTTVGQEATDSYYDYRSGAAFLTDPVQFGLDGKFSITYTFSMPEAVVNYEQAGGGDFAREVGGDGIGLIVTTKKTDAVEAGSGIGYQNMEDSLTIEADSFFNGAYCYFSGNNSFDLQNWGFDNQLYFRTNGQDGGTDDFGTNPYQGGYISNYQNPNHEERFDHFAITEDGNVKGHEKIYYVNGIDPEETDGNLYKNLSGTVKRTDKSSYVTYNSSANTSPATPSKDSKCATRFADKGVDDRLFTVWVDYDGTSMSVYYANGSLSTATKPGTPIMTQKISMSRFNGKDVYLGFTSAVGTSKANHTIHSLKVTVPEEVTAQASYVLKYWLKNPTTGEYELQADDTSDIYTDNVGTRVTADDVDSNYASKYDKKGYQLSTTKKQETNVVLEKENTTYEMNVYYDPQEDVTAQASYVLKYWLKNPVTGEYELQADDTSDIFTDNVGTKVTADDVDSNYLSKYDSKGYKLSTTKEQETNAVLEKENTTYEMNVYYDPQEAYYKLNYYVKNDNGEYELKDSTEVATDVVGSTHTVGEVDPDYGTKYPNYYVNTDKTEDYKVTLTEAGKTYEMNVYYDPETLLPGVKLNYYKLNPNTGEYEYIESTKTESATVGETKTVEDLDANYEQKYTNDGYTYNSNKKDTYQVDIAEDDKVYEVDAYYDPTITKYKTEYYLEQPDGSFKRQDADTIVTEDVYAGTNVIAQEKTYNGYTHVIVSESNEQDVVAADGSTVLKVYYKLPEVQVTAAPTVAPTAVPTLVPSTPTNAPVQEPTSVPMDQTVVTPTPTVEVPPTEEPTPKVKATKKPVQEENVDVDTPADHSDYTEETPETGDHTNWKLPMIFMLFSAMMAGELFVKIRKKEDDK